MNNNDRFLWGKLRGILCVAALVIVMASCFDEDTAPVQPVPVSYVSIYHASPDAPGLDIVVDDRQINTNSFDYSDFSGYLNFRTGERNFKLTAVNAANTFLDTTFSFVDGKAYSVFIADKVASIEAVLLTDSAAQPASGKAMLRFIHLSPDASAVDIVSDKLEDGKTFKGKTFKMASGFSEVDAASYSFSVKEAGTDKVLLTANDINIQEGGFYTVILRGLANPPSGVTNVLSLEVL
jgi:hypothetical protein